MKEFVVGEMVQHSAFGKGIVISATPISGDVLLEITFDNIGTKRFLSRSASKYISKI